MVADDEQHLPQQRHSVPRPQPASTVRHNNLPPWVLSTVLPAFFLLFVLLSIAAILMLTWFTTRHLFGPGPHCTIVVVFPLALLGCKIYDFVRRLVESGRALETGEKSVGEWDGYRDEKLMGEIWDVSPYNYQNRSMNEGGGRSKDRAARQEIEGGAICFQPKEGYCGPASVNTILLSQNPPMAIPYTVLPKQYSMDALYAYVEAANSSMNGGLFDRIELVRTTEAMTLAEFRRHLLEANSPGCRVLANFHRKPLFAPERSGGRRSSWRKSLKMVMGAHWSPIGGVLPRQERPDQLVDAVLVLDVNKSYGPYMLPIDRLFWAVRTKNVYGAYRGLIKLYLKIGSDSCVDKKTD